MKNISIQSRNMLREISQNFNENQNIQNYQKQTNFYKPFDGMAKLNQHEKKRITQLKNKYRISNQLSSVEHLEPNSKQTQVDSSFSKIHVPSSKTFKEKQNINKTSFIKSNSSIKSSSSFNYSRYENFEKKVQQSDIRIGSRIQQVQKKMQFLRQLQNETKQNQTIQLKSSKISQNLSKMNSKILDENNSGSSQVSLENRMQKNYETLKGQDQKLEKSQNSIQESNYTKQLKSINFIDDIRKKIEQIQSQRKSNIQKKLSEISSTSKTSLSNILNAESQHNLPLNNQQNKITLKNLVPNLSESEVIEPTQRQIPKYKSIFEDSTFVDKYDLFTKNESQSSMKPFQNNDQIAEVSQNEELSMKGSPYSNKSPYHEVSLQETQLVERHSLKGDFSNIQQTIEKQFTLLINRLAYQAQIDNKFACQIFKYSHILSSKQQDLKQILVSMIREYCQQSGSSFNQSVFEVNQMEIDPLLSNQKVYKDLHYEEMRRLAYNLKKSSDKIDNYFEMKIFCCFQLKTVKFFIQELQKCHSLREDEPFNMGHLTSYINMRTGKDLRNRYFYRIMKRILKNPKNLSSTFTKEELIESFVNKSSNKP